MSVVLLFNQPLATGPLVVTPTVTTVEGTPVPAKPRSVAVVQGQLATVLWTIVDRNGNSIDLTALSQQPGGVTVQLKITEALSFNNSQDSTITITGSVVSLAQGQVQATLTMPTVTLPGISIGEFAILVNGNLAVSNWFYLIVEPSQAGAVLAGGYLQDAGAPSLGEVRMYLRDADPGGNLWLASYEWDMAEIMACIVRPIREFNETPPPLDQVWNTANFPWRHNWLLAITGYLMRLAADWYRRVALPYEAGGVRIDDKTKFEQYDARGQELLENWRNWVRLKRIQINIEGGWATFDSPYSWGYNSSGVGGFDNDAGYW